MWVQLHTSGRGAVFPKLATSFTIDVNGLAEDQRHAFEELVRDARFFELPAHLPAPRGAADYQTFVITIEDAGRRHTVSVTDPVQGPALQKLLDRLRDLESRGPYAPATRP
jgi:hypothetical protein